MATLAATNPTLSDVAKRLDPDGKVDTIVEILNETNEVLQDATWTEGNLPTGHKSTIRSGLPGVTWRKLYAGVQPTKSRTVQVTDTAGMLEAYAEVDKSLADLNGQQSNFRISEDRAFLESMSQEMADQIFYGDTSLNPERFLGLDQRFNSTTAESGDNVLLGGGSGSDNTSIWLVVWGPQTCHMFFPKGSKAGLTFEDKGQVTLEDAAGGKFEGYRSHYKWDGGLTLRDWRYVVRICNIDVSDLTKDASGSSADLIDLMIQAIELIPTITMGRAVFYCARTVKSFLRRQIKNENNVNITQEQVAGKMVTMFDGIPVRRVDKLLVTEATIS